MKKITFSFILTTMMSLLFVSVIEAQSSETRNLGAFNGIAVSTSVNATIQKGSANRVEITVNGIELDKVSTEIEDGILKVGIKNNKGNWSWTKKSKVEATITYTDVPEYISVSSSADLIGTDVITGRNLEIKASSSGDMKIEVDVDELKASASSSADVIISGRAKEANISVSSSADFLGKKLQVDHAQVSASSSGDLEISVGQSIDAQASSSGDITYFGNPQKKNVNKSSSGDVTQKKG